MRFTYYAQTLFIFFTYLILSAAPFFPYLQQQPVEHAYLIIGVEIFAWAFIWSLFKKPSWFHFLLIPAFLALPIEIYLHLFYKQGISPHHLGLILETSPKEALEFLGSKAWLLLFILIACIYWWWLSWQCTRRAKHLQWSGVSRFIPVILLSLFLASWAYGEKFGVQEAPARITASNNDEEETDAPDSTAEAQSASALASNPYNLPPLPYWANLSIDAVLLNDTRPFGLGMIVYNFWSERHYLTQLATKNTHFQFHTKQQKTTNTPQIFIMVIGESSRYDRWSLNGYRRDTNPLLSKIDNLTPLSNVVTAVSATRLSVPIIISRKPATHSLQAGFSEKSFLSAFKEAGFKTFWLSNQMSFGQFDTPVSVFAKEADVLQFINFGGFTDHSSFDEALLTPLERAINDPSPKKLIVLHTLGNHWNYSHRYPKEFDKWKPSLFGVNNPAYTDIKIKPQLNNSYDNSILYTDWFLSEVINRLQNTKLLSSLIYVSDHGQTLYDGSCNLAFHGHNTQYEFHIPVFVWVSDLYKSTFPKKVEQLVQHQHAPLSTENMFHSFVDMADIQYPKQRLEWSLFNTQLTHHKRYVDSHGWSNYDRSTFKGDCKEVIDKGKPLTQSK